VPRKNRRSTTLRSGRDDLLLCPQELQREILAPATEFSSRPKQSVVETRGFLRSNQQLRPTGRRPETGPRQ
jgi:hypothetical protein